MLQHRPRLRARPSFLDGTTLELVRKVLRCDVFHRFAAVPDPVTVGQHNLHPHNIMLGHTILKVADIRSEQTREPVNRMRLRNHTIDGYSAG